MYFFKSKPKTFAITGKQDISENFPHDFYLFIFKFNFDFILEYS